jgi:hypothetical protein
MQIVESRVPHEAIMEGWLRLHDVPLDRLVQRSHRYERAYLAWETVRLGRNPYFNKGTGFEGYFVGVSHSTEEMLTQLIEIGREILLSNCRLYRHQYSFRAKLMKTLEGDCNDPQAMYVWSALLGATLAKLRCNVHYHFKTYYFQNETYWAVNRLPFIKYKRCEHHIEQEYRLAVFKGSYASQPDFSLDMLKSSDYDAGLVVLKIGCFGHPLIRAYLGEVNSYTYIGD